MLQVTNEKAYGSFIREALRVLALLHRTHRFYLLVGQPPDPGITWPSNMEMYLVKAPGKNLVARVWWQERTLAGILKKINADLFLAPDGFCSLGSPVPQCVMVPDLDFLDNPERFSKAGLFYHHMYRQRSLRKAARIAVFSEAVQQQVKEKFQLDASVVPPAVSLRYHRLTTEEATAVKEKYAGGTEYFICFGPLREQQLLHLLKAFSFFKKRQKSSMKLVLCMGENEVEWLQKRVAAYRYREELVRIGSSDEELRSDLLAAAYAMADLQPGAGPAGMVLKAMHCGVPVLAATTKAAGVQKEILYFDAQDISSIAAQLMLVYKDEQLRTRLVQEGLMHAGAYSWDHTAAALWKWLVAGVRD